LSYFSLSLCVGESLGAKKLKLKNELSLSESFDLKEKSFSVNIFSVLISDGFDST